MIVTHEASIEEVPREEARGRIVAAAIDLLRTGGRDALTTRAVAAASGVQAPTLYRLFGDKGGLLDAVVEHGFRTYLGEKEVRPPGPDPVEDLRRGWDLHIEFGLANPEIYTLMYGAPRPGARSAAASISQEILERHIRRIAVAGRLRVSEPRAAELVHASGCGTVFTLLAMTVEGRDLGLSRAACDAVLAAITSGASQVEETGATQAAITLRAALPEIGTTFTPGECAVLGEWLDRLSVPL